jgi:putative glutamine amidotransferase
MRIGLSYFQERPKDRLYESVLLEAGRRAGLPIEAVWLAGIDQPVDRAALESLDGIVLTGGADVDPKRYGFADPDGVCRFALPERDVVEVPIVESALERRLPILAICRGMQLLNVVCGGTLVPDFPGHDWEDDDRRHAVKFEPDSMLAREILGKTAGDVSSSHHQAVDRPGAGLRVVAWSPDGIAEAIEWAEPSETPWLAAVQWHPERMPLDEPTSGPIYRAFLRQVAKQKQEAPF